MNKKSLFSILICSTVLLISCSQKVSNTVMYESFAEDGSFSTGKAMAKMMSVESPAAEMSPYNSADYSGEEVPAFTERKLIKTGNISVEVQSLENLDSSVQEFAKRFGGYVTNTYSDEDSFSATIKVPCENFEEAMVNAGNMGKIKSKSQNSSDVTDEFYDLESRINSKKILKVKLEQYLGQAKDMKDLLEIEKQLNSVISELDSMEGRMKRLTNQISYSTINLNAWLPSGENRAGFVWPDLGEKFRNLGTNTVNFFSKLLIGIFYLIIFGIPIAAIIAFLYWLLFGRLGLLVKLFKYLSKK